MTFRKNYHKTDSSHLKLEQAELQQRRHLEKLCHREHERCAVLCKRKRWLLFVLPQQCRCNVLRKR